MWEIIPLENNPVGFNTFEKLSVYPVNPLMHGRLYRSKIKMLCAVVKLNSSILFLIGASATKSCDKSRIFRYGLPFFFKGKKTTAGGGRTLK